MLKLLIVLFFCHTPVLFAGDWKHEKSKNGIDVYTKSIKNSSIKALRGIGVLEVPVDKLCGILRNVENAVNWVPDLLERSYVKHISDTEAVLYDVTDMPWPVTDRDFIAHYKLELSDDAKSMILNFKSVKSNKKKEKEKYVRAIIKKGSIIFTPVSKSKTKVELNVLVDPKGGIPAWIVNIVQVSVPFNFINALGKFAKKSKLAPLPGIQKLINGLKLP